MRNLYPFARLLRIASETISRRLTLVFLLCGVLAISASAQTTRYVNTNASGANNGTSWTDAFTSLQAALDAASSGDQIWVAKGTYKPSKDVSGSATPSDVRTKTFLLKNGVKLYGGFDAASSTRDVKAYKTILSGDRNGDDVGFTGNGENYYHVVIADALTAATELDGFTISGGNADNSTTFLGNSYGNRAAGGLYINGNTGAQLKVNNCTFTNNSAGLYGVIYMADASCNPSFSNCIIENNKATGVVGANFTITNSVLANNAGSWGGGIWCNATSSSTATIVNCTIYGNSQSGSSDGGGVAVWNSADVNIKNTIIWGNLGAGADLDIANSGSQVTYSAIEGGYAGTGNINTDPLFVDAADLNGADNIWGTADDGFNLGIGSPAANTGNNADVPAGMTTDIMGSARIQNTIVNMGAYETEAPQTAQTINFTAIGSKTYGDAAFTVSAIASSGLSVTYSIVSGPATVSGNNVSITGAGSVVLKAVQAGNATYEPAEATQTITINKKAITVTADALSKTYGDADPTLTYITAPGALVGSDAFTGSLTRFAGETAGQVYAIEQGSLALNSNYTITFVSDWLTINKRLITITANDATKTAGETMSFVGDEYSLTGSLGFTDAIASVTLSSTGAAAGAAPGTYAIVPSAVAGISTSNYTITYVDGILMVNPCVAPSVATPPANQTVCPGNSVTFSVVATGSGLTYQWLKDGAAISATADNYTISAVTGGDAASYSVAVSNGCGTVTSTAATLSVNVTTAITTPPVAKTVCAGGTATFQVTAMGSNLTYQWKKDGADIALANSATLSIPGVSAAHAGNYSVVVSGDCGNATSTGVALTVRPLTATTTHPVSQAVCESGSVTFTGAADGTGNSYKWQKDGSDIAGAFSTSYTISAVTAADAGNYRLVATSACGVATSNAAALTVNALPATPTITPGSATTFCNAGSVTLTSTATSGNQWYKDGAILMGETGQTYIATTSGTYTVQTTVSTCSSSVSLGTTVTVNPAPAQPTVSTSGSTTFCEGGSVVLTSSAATGNQWYKDGAVINGATNPTYTATTSGNYTVAVTASSCTSAASAATVVVNATPAIPVITATGNVLSSSANTANQWFLNGTAITGATGQTHRVQASGLYKVRVTSGSCSSTSTDYNFVATRIDNPGIGNGEVSLYPNPVLETLTVKNATGRKLHVRIYDGFGKKVHESQLSATQGSIDVQGFSAGIYQVVVADQANQVIRTQTIVKL
jgi:trimeric autotransporter adhesin